MPRGADFAVGPHAHQIGIAGPKPAADDAPHDYSLLLASAFTAATVIAEPPRRPSTVSAGAGGLAINAALASAAPTKPTGQPMIAAGRGQDCVLQHVQKVEQRGRRIADGDDGAIEMRPPQFQRRGRARIAHRLRERRERRGR